MACLPEPPLARLSENPPPMAGFKNKSNKGDGATMSSTIRTAELARLVDAIPPHAVESEMSLLGAMLFDPKMIADVVPIVKTGRDFHNPAHGVLYDVMVSVYDRTASLDMVQVNQELTDKGLLEQVGGLDYLVHLAGSVPTAANAEQFARIVREKATLRALIAAGGEILRDAHALDNDVQEVLEQAEQRIFKIAQQREHASAESLKELLQETMRLIDANDGKHMTGVPSGYADMDDLLNGLQPGELLILAARPSMGKTALALNMMEQMALAGHPTAMFSLEMSKQQLVQRMVCARGRIDSQRLRRNMLKEDDYDRLLAACGDLSEAPIYIDDTPGLSLLQLRSKGRRLKDRFGIKAIIVDYLQLMSAGGRVESRQLEVSEISRGIKAMARELEVPVLCLSQLNRAAEQREGHRPRMSDLRESGAIEQDADVILMLHREEYYHKGDHDWVEQNPDKAAIAEVIVAKQRNGPTGVITLGWNSESTRFQDLSRATAPTGKVVSSREWDTGGLPT
jgi:replicative DNA helicase